jgi:Bacterial pre-peptidase C-terminal domain
VDTLRTERSISQRHIPIQRTSQVVVYLILAALTLSISLQPVLAQDTLQLFSPVTGQIAAGSQQQWTFTAPNGAVLSFSVESTSGNLDPAFSISSSAGTELIRNDDYNFPASRDALLEAITIPRTDTYTLTVFGAGDTSGEYRLTMTSGFSQIESSDNFNGDLNWKTVPDTQGISGENGQLTLAASGISQSILAINPKAKTPVDYYAQVTVNVGGEGGWLVGMTARQQDIDHYYLLQINESGQWRFVLHEPDSDQVVRDWTPHPAIIAGNGSFTLGMMVNGAGFDFFYNGQFFGRLTDSTLSTSGQLGLMATTRATLTSQATAHFDDLTVTIPLEIKGKRIIPQQLLGGKASDAAQELQRRSLIPAGGAMGLTVASSFVESGHPGVQRVMLGRGTTYDNFAMASTISWTAVSSGATGCGLVFRSADDTHYTLAYLDQSGAYGVSQRDGDAFKPGIFGEGVNLKSPSHQLVVVAQDNQLFYYLDGLYRGTMKNEVIDGAVGNAVVDFEPISTSCQFTDTWVWDFSGQ